jgi:type I restriction enzyme, S subunit
LSTWKKYKLGEVGEIVGGGTPSTTRPEYFTGEIPWLTPKDLTGYSFKYISKGERNISETGLAKSGAKILPAGSVLMSSRAPIGYLAIAANEIATNQGFKSVICDTSVVDNIFLYYYLKNNISQLHSIATGTTFLEVSGAALRNFEIHLPAVSEQTAIAEILSAFDDKIELNLQTNKTLEEMAQAIYKHWFVDFGPFKDGKFVKSDLGMIPEGWEVKRLGEIVQLSYGKALKETERTAGEFPVYGSSGVVGTHSSYLVEGSAIIIGRKGNVGSIFWEYQNCFPIDTSYFIKTKKDSLLRYLFFVLKSIDFKSTNSDSVVPGLNREVAYSQKIILPSENSLDEFYSCVNLLFELTKKNELENQTLKQTRDYLLPKLISGEIRVKGADKKIKELV